MDTLSLSLSNFIFLHLKCRNVVFLLSEIYSALIHIGGMGWGWGGKANNKEFLLTSVEILQICFKLANSLHALQSKLDISELSS